MQKKQQQGKTTWIIPDRAILLALMDQEMKGPSNQARLPGNSNSSSSSKQRC